jgi:hypothetical protein
MILSEIGVTGFVIAWTGRLMVAAVVTAATAAHP